MPRFLKASTKTILPLCNKNLELNLQNFVENTQKDFPILFKKADHESIPLSNKEIRILQNYFSFVSFLDGEIFSTKDDYYMHHSGKYEMLGKNKENPQKSTLLGWDGQINNYKTVKECHLFKISKKDFDYCCKQFPKLYFKFYLNESTKIKQK